MRNDTLDTDDRNKVDKTMIGMIANKKLAHSVIEKKILKDLYDRLERRWQEDEVKENQIRIDTLVKVIHDMSQEQWVIFLKQHRSWFVPKHIMFLILKNKEEVEWQQSELFWKIFFGPTLKQIETVNINDEHNSGEFLGVSSP